MTLKTNPKSPYPRYFKTPEGRPVTARTMSAALRQIRKYPDKDYPGWNWFPTPGHAILRSFREGLHDRINQRGAMEVAR